MNELTDKTVGFIGLGLMGRPMCRNLMKAGLTPVVYNRSPQPRQELAREGAVAADSPAEVAEQADIIVIMVADTPAVEHVLTGPDGVLHSLRSATLLIDMGTTAVPATRRLAALVEEKGALYVDAPVSGGTIGAEAGTLTIMAGGSEQAFALARPVLSLLGERITHVGATGAGQVAKAANQVIVGLNIGAVAEALALAKAAGVDPARVRAALRGGFADSRILEVHGQRMLDNNFAPGGKCTTQRKDMHQALELAAELGLEMPATALSRDLYDRLIDDGDGDLDHAALFRLYTKS
ncbi:MAG: NAD(P)-dependent oxidoreductase [Desulfobulbaceae bacterium]|uniref:2-hydroxy-3-oxopropionate reductase n=2 Tax=Desulfofustis glycolicus TaxID=51195 RepID=A0A1M5TQ70_9BACT|nr:NAD(P)-dependent oxidoreductase [Desulfobulbaceae bacterium]SHH52746.1 2-hydroxy-3-oxopropionate reductase [Desulfofustis glycolicus DSM 9705]